MALLDVRNLQVAYRNPSSDDQTMAVDGVSFAVERGETLGIVGESGCGKSTLARALMAYCRPGGEIVGGEVLFDGTDIFGLKDEQIRALRGSRMAMVPQDPLTSLTYHMKVGPQVDEILRIHQELDAKGARLHTLKLFAGTNLPEPEKIYHRYPHENSGGQRQRVVIAGALACEPDLLILDEPTTALDTTTEMQVLKLVKELRDRMGTALIYITHDLTLTDYMCENVLVMLNGKVVERGQSSSVFSAPQTDYGKALVAAIPRVDAKIATPAQPNKAKDGAPLLKVEHLSFRYPSRWSVSALFNPVEEPLAVDDVSFELPRGETLGLVGESGSGKSTIANIIVGLSAPTSGAITFDGAALGATDRHRSPELKRRIQIIFQDPLSSLNPRRRIESILTRPQEIFFGVTGKAARDRAVELLEDMELSADLLKRFPRQLSGGQQQRVAIARAFAASPDLILCDEITSALDVSVQAHVLRLLRGIQIKTGAACLFISHDLGVVKQVAGETVVLRKGRAVEAGHTSGVFDNPSHDYTRLLLAAALRQENYADLVEQASRTEIVGNEP
ncbi:MAG: ABC transporter ATP-binding protein [Rhodospirillaceae bacterium]|jgi:peptide/nickel transport system ATP-binding protein|nr:ABC transporter ATP-binding protein [Rhodospirillaceae bacterium]MBT6136653.1 ABC transporter ATP-binding protein [Rhodospirillaceae bacterium]